MQKTPQGSSDSSPSESPNSILKKKQVQLNLNTEQLPSIDELKEKLEEEA